MKRFLAILVSALLLTTMLLGAAVAEAPVTIRFLNGFTGGDGAFMKKITDGFNASQSKYVVEELQEKDHYVKFETGEYDLVVIHGDLLPTYQINGAIQPVDSLYEAAGLKPEDFHPTGAAMVTLEDQQYAFPLDIHPLTMFYNKKLVPEAPKTYEEILALAGKLGDNVYPMGIPGSGLSEWYMMFLAAQNNVELTDEGALKFDTPEFAEVLLKLNQMLFVDKVSPVGLGLDGEFTTFMTDKPDASAVQTAVALTGPWFYTAALEKYGEDLGVAPLPVIGKGPGSYGGAHTIAVSAKVTDPAKLEAIAEYMKYMFTTENLLNWADSGQAPLYLPVIEYLAAHQEEYPLSYTNTLQFENTRIAPPVYNVREQSQYLGSTIYNLVVTKEGLTLDELMPELEKATSLAREIADE